MEFGFYSVIEFHVPIVIHSRSDLDLDDWSCARTFLTAFLLYWLLDSVVTVSTFYAT